MKEGKTTFALFFGNRGFFPVSLIQQAREKLICVLRELGHGALMLPETATPHGAVETAKEGAKCARFLREHEGQYDGVLLSLSNFGYETGVVAALDKAGAPILIQAYPDGLDRDPRICLPGVACARNGVLTSIHVMSYMYTKIAQKHI